MNKRDKIIYIDFDLNETDRKFNLIGKFNLSGKIMDGLYPLRTFFLKKILLKDVKEIEDVKNYLKILKNILLIKKNENSIVLSNINKYSEKVFENFVYFINDIDILNFDFNQIKGYLCVVKSKDKSNLISKGFYFYLPIINKFVICIHDMKRISLLIQSNRMALNKKHLLPMASFVVNNTEVCKFFHSEGYFAPFKGHINKVIKKEDGDFFSQISVVAIKSVSRKNEFYIKDINQKIFGLMWINSKNKFIPEAWNIFVLLGKEKIKLKSNFCLPKLLVNYKEINFKLS